LRTYGRPLEFGIVVADAPVVVNSTWKLLERWWRMHPASLQKVYKGAYLRQP